MSSVRYGKDRRIGHTDKQTDTQSPQTDRGGHTQRGRQTEHLCAELDVHDVGGDVLKTAAVGVDEHAQGQLKLTALLQHLQHVVQRAQQGLKVAGACRHRPALVLHVDRLTQL